MMNRNQRYLACILSALCMMNLTSCGTVPEQSADHAEEAVSDTEMTETTEILPSEETVSEEIPETETAGEVPETQNQTLQDFDFAELYFNQGYKGYSLEDENLEKVISLCSGLHETDLKELTLSDSEEWQLILGGEKTYSRVQSANGWVIVNNDMQIYDDSPELNAFACAVYVENQESSTPAPETYYTISCSEPVAEEEYVRTAEQLLEAWLTSLQSDDTEEYYRNTGFSIALPEKRTDTYTSYKNHWLASGIVDGEKEFCVELCFTADDCGDNTFYDKYYQEGRYTVGGTFWSGQYLCGRFRYENGSCSLIDITSRDGSDRMQKGLNGIPDGEYKTFFDFARRPDWREATDSSFEGYGNYTVSSNLTMTMDGVPLHIDVYCFGAESSTEDTISAVMDERSYNADHTKTYSSGVYYTDNGTGQKVLTLPKEFEITFDNYDGDGNPDYCIKYDEDENGSYYVLESVQSDGRIFNLSGRAWEGGIYLAGCDEPSPRLQISEKSRYIGWKYENGEYYPTDSAGNKIDLPELHMYSERYYLPDTMKLYSQDENTVYCFLWNNTGQDVTTDTEYAIEMLNNGEWLPVSEQNPAASVTIPPRSCAEIAYDISGIRNRVNTTYRIVQKCGNQTAYGNFWLDGSAVEHLSIESVSLEEGALSGSFTYADTGITSNKIQSVVITGNGKEYPLLLRERHADEIYFLLSDGIGLSAGTYQLIINNTVSREFEIAQTQNWPEAAVSLSRSEDSLSLHVSADQPCVLEMAMIYHKKNGKYTALPYMPDETGIDIQSETEIKLSNLYQDSEWTEYLYEMIQEYGNEEELSYFSENGIDYQEGMTLEEFTEMLNKNTALSDSEEVLIYANMTDTDGNPFIRLVRTKISS